MTLHPSSTVGNDLFWLVGGSEAMPWQKKLHTGSEAAVMQVCMQMFSSRLVGCESVHIEGSPKGAVDVGLLEDAPHDARAIYVARHLLIALAK